MTTASKEGTQKYKADLTLNLLGPFALEVPGHLVPPLSRAARSLLALLALRSPRPLDRESLAVTLWPESGDEAARYNLRRTLTELRAALGSQSHRLTAPTPQTLRFDLSTSDEGGGGAGTVSCDVVALDALLALRDDDARLGAALEQYGGTSGDLQLLPGERGEWVLPEREARAQAYLAAREGLAQRLGERGEWQSAAGHLRAVLAADPLRETALRALMRALNKMGQSAAALAEYQRLRDQLRDEADLAPDAETTSLYKQLLAESKLRVAAVNDGLASAKAAQRSPESLTSLVSRQQPDGREASVVDADSRYPTGAITFLFTDIEGSTRSWQAHPDQMRLALARHDALVREAIEASHGVVFKTVGDGFYVAFAVPADALAAAVQAQLALLGEPWPDATPIRVRMALHTGVAELRDGDYFGSTVNRTARLLSAGHGGQALVSAASYELLRDSLTAGVGFYNLGKQWLRDLDRPEEIFAVSHPELQEPGSFPPLRTLESPSLPNNLPRQATSFIGREAQIEEVRDLLAKTSLLTLVGTGGTGKTRLALQAAAAALENYPDGVWLVEFAPVADAELAAQTVAQALGIKEQTEQTIEQTLTNHLQSRRLLLLLDNCEHIVEACAHLTSTLLRSCSGITLLATSREPLGVSGEQSYRVPPLSLPDPKAPNPTSAQDLNRYESVRLFSERASLVKTSFAITNTNAPALAQLCFQLDGIPLALELAAARIRSLSVDEINNRLVNRFRLLTNSDRSVLPRQQTLRALIDWSYDLLSDREKTLLSRLSVFAGGWTLSAAESVCAGEFPSPDLDPLEDWEVLDLLTSLVDKSLVLSDDLPEGTRYRMLESLRQYAAEKIDEFGEARRVRDRHRDWCLQLAEEAKPHLLRSTALEWHTRLESEHDNLRAALAWCAVSATDDAAPEASRIKASLIGLRLSADLVRFWLARGYLNEGREQIHRALAEWRTRLPEQLRSDDVDDQAQETRPPEESLRAWKIAVTGALTAASILANAQGDSSAAMPMLAESLALSREIRDKRGIASSLGTSGTAAFNRGDFAEARLRNAESLALYRELGDQWSIASALNNIGTAASDQGDYDVARALFTESLAIRRETGEPSVIADSLNNLGIVAFRQGDLAGARAQYEECMAIKRAIGDKNGVANSLNNLSLIASYTGDYTRASALLEEGLSLARELGDRRGTANALDNLAGVRFYQDDLQTAFVMFEEALSVRRQIGDRKGVAHTLGNLSETAEMLGDSVRARALLTESLAMHRETGDKLGVALALLNIGSAHFKERDYLSACTLYRESLSLFREMGNKGNAALVMSRLAEVDLKEGDVRRAVVLWAAADTLRVQVGLAQHSTEKAEAEVFLMEARSVLEDVTFSAAWVEGCALAWEQAVNYALHE